ncbi:hypothetical protein [Chitinophaga sedimenti]|nr:hypothetical protein [Chitinophaga sedimenti]
MQDTVAIRKLLRQASALVYKPGERKADLQAAQSLLDQVFKKAGR